MNWIEAYNKCSLKYNKQKENKKETVIKVYNTWTTATTLEKQDTRFS